MFDSIFPKHWTTLQRLMWLKTNALARAVYETITGNPVTFTAKAAPLRQLSVAFSPVQSGTGDPSPDNVRPISGWDSVTVGVSGKNFTPAPVGVAVTSNGWVASDTPTHYGVVDTFPVKGGQQYVFSLHSSEPITGSTNIVCWQYDKDGNRIAAATLTKVTTDPNCVAIKWRTSAQISQLPDDVTFQLELGETATAYTPYNPSSRSISISIGETVYSGYVDVISGVGEITGVLDVFNVPNQAGTQIADSLGLYSITPYGGGAQIAGDYTRMSFAVDQTEKLKYAKTSSQYAYQMCNLAKHLFSYADESTHWYINDNALYVMLPTAVCGSTKQECIDYLISIKDTKPLSIYIPLVDPIPIQLTPQEVQSLLGENVMWSDANGDLTVTYRSN